MTIATDQLRYARLAGGLSRELPRTFGDAAPSRGTDGVWQELMSLRRAPGAGG